MMILFNFTCENFPFTCRYDTARDENNFEQPRIFWRNVLNEDERTRLVQNLVNDLKRTADFIQVCTR